MFLSNQHLKIVSPSKSNYREQFISRGGDVEGGGWEGVGGRPEVCAFKSEFTLGRRQRGFIRCLNEMSIVIYLFFFC